MTSVQPNFYLWGAWKSRTIKEPFLTKKVAAPLKKIVLGETFIIGLTEKGQCVSWGKDAKNGCLGLGNDQKGDHVVEVAQPADIEGMHKVSDIQMGTDHVVALTAVGEVFCWGKNDRGQLGVGDYDTHWRPVKVETLAGEQIMQIAVVKNSTFALSTSGVVFAWGDNKDNTLGLEPDVAIEKTEVPKRLSLLGEMRVRKLEIFENRTIIAHVRAPESDGDDLEAAGGGAAEAAELQEAKDSTEVEIFKGIDELQKAMEKTQEWWNHLLYIKHGQPYDLPSDVGSGTGETAKTGAGTQEDDLSVDPEKLKRAQRDLDALVKVAVAELQRTQQLPGTRNVRFILCMFIDECRLRREKVRATISARQIVDLKREAPDISGYSVTNFGNNANEDIRKIIAVQKELQRMNDRLKHVEPVDALSIQLKITLMECLDNKIMLNDTRVELLKAAEAKPSDPMLPALRIIKDRWNSLKHFSLYSLYLDAEQKADQFNSHDEHLAYLVNASNAQINQMLQIDKDRIISHDTLVPALCYDLLRENAELRKMANSYQLHVLMIHKGKNITSADVGNEGGPLSIKGG